jgi:hypothetical protein
MGEIRYLDFLIFALSSHRPTSKSIEFALLAYVLIFVQEKYTPYIKERREYMLLSVTLLNTLWAVHYVAAMVLQKDNVCPYFLISSDNNFEIL